MSAQSQARHHSPPSRSPSPPYKKRKSLDYHANWERETRSTDLCETEVDDPTWHEFYKYWWGPSSPGNAAITAALSSQDPAERIIQVTDPHMWTNLCLLEESNGHILIRADYDILYDMVLRGSTIARIKGALILGQPGIGNSYFAVYVLLRRMSDGLPVLFSTSSGATYLFDKFGVWFKRENLILEKNMSKWDHKDTASRVWYIVDPMPKASAQTGGNKSFFTVLATSPQEAQYKDWYKDRETVGAVANPWPAEELHVMLSNNGMTCLSPESRAPYQTLEAVVDLVDTIGPCPRDILRYLPEPRRFCAHIQRALVHIESVKDIINTFEESTRNMNALPHTLVLLRRLKVDDDDGHDVSVQFKTRHIASKALTLLGTLRWDDAHALFHAAEHSPASRSLAGWTFEKLAVGYISGSEIVRDPKKPVIGAFKQMRQIKSKARFRFEHTSGIPRTGFSVEADGRMLQTTIDDADLAPPGNTSATTNPPVILPIQKRPVVTYSRAELPTLFLQETRCYAPLQRNNPLFDSFFVQVTQESVVLWVFQMTITKDHGGSTKGVEVLLQIREQLKSRYGIEGKEVKMRYVLVAPYYPNRRITWTMPDEWSAVEGDVFVQYLDLTDLCGADDPVSIL